MTVTIPFKDVRWSALLLVTNASTVLTNQTTWLCMKDLGYPTTTPQPPSG